VDRLARHYRKGILLILLAWCSAACDRRPESRVVLEADDLIARLPSAEQRSARALEESIRVESAGPPSDRRVALVTVAPVRVIWTARLPERAWIDTAVMLTAGSGATARIGVSDLRLYEGLTRIELKASAGGMPDAWHDVRVDLHRYAGWQWSVFYRPSETEWRLIFSADATPEGTIAWARPMIKRER
jgi:hypothetical protein